MSLSRRSLLASAIGLTAASVVAPRQAEASGSSALNYGLGVCIPAYAGKEGGILFATDLVMRSQIDAAVGARIGWLRTDMVVQQGTSPTNGGYDWSAWERTFAYARSRGMRVLACLQGQACVDGPAPSQPVTRAARAHVASFAGAAARHFEQGTKYKIDALEIGNEVNTNRFWPSPSVKHYGSLLSAVYRAVKAARPSLPVIAGGTGGCAVRGDIPTTEWYRLLYAAGYQRYFDALALHPYSDFTVVPGRNEERHIAAVRAIMNAHGDRRKRIWATESGVPTGGSYGVSEPVQARVVQHSFHYFRHHAARRGPWFVYSLDDFAPAGSSNDAENYFGLRTSTGRLKPAYWAVTRLAETSAGRS